MEHISFFLKKFSGLGMEQVLVKEEVCKIVEELCGIKLSTKDVSYKDGEVVVNGSKMLKSELFIRRGEILEGLEKNLNKLKIRRIS